MGWEAKIKDAIANLRSTLLTLSFATARIRGALDCETAAGLVSDDGSRVDE